MESSVTIPHVTPTDEILLRVGLVSSDCSTSDLDSVRVAVSRGGPISQDALADVIAAARRLNITCGGAVLALPDRRVSLRSEQLRKVVRGEVEFETVEEYDTRSFADTREAAIDAVKRGGNVMVHRCVRHAEAALLAHGLLRPSAAAARWSSPDGEEAAAEPEAEQAEEAHEQEPEQPLETRLVLFADGSQLRLCCSLLLVVQPQAQPQARGQRGGVPRLARITELEAVVAEYGESAADAVARLLRPRRLEQETPTVPSEKSIALAALNVDGDGETGQWHSRHLRGAGAGGGADGGGGGGGGGLEQRGVAVCVAAAGEEAAQQLQLACRGSLETDSSRTGFVLDSAWRPSGPGAALHTPELFARGAALAAQATAAQACAEECWVWSPPDSSFMRPSELAKKLAPMWRRMVEARLPPEQRLTKAVRELSPAPDDCIPTALVEHALALVGPLIQAQKEVERIGQAESDELARLERERQAELEHRAVAMVQARFRGTSWRKDLQQQHWASSVISSHIKGRRSRKKGALKQRLDIRIANKTPIPRREMLKLTQYLSQRGIAVIPTPKNRIKSPRKKSPRKK